MGVVKRKSCLPPKSHFNINLNRGGSMFEDDVVEEQELKESRDISEDLADDGVREMPIPEATEQGESKRDYEGEIKGLGVILEKEVSFSSEVMEENKNLKKEIEALKKDVELKRQLIKILEGKYTFSGLVVGEKQGGIDYYKNIIKNIIAGK